MNTNAFKHLWLWSVLFLLMLIPSARAQAKISLADTKPVVPFESLFDVDAESAPLCRLGVNGPSEGLSTYPLADLRTGWYMNFTTTTTPERPNGMEYMPVVRLCPTDRTPAQGPSGCYPHKLTDAQLQQKVQALPGSVWFIGNEPDRPDSVLTGQDAVEPDVYAQRYHDVYTLIKAADPSAKVFAGSIVQATELRMKYLDAILASYRDQYGTQMPVDGWNFHNYILNEKSCKQYPREECWGADVPPGLPYTEGLVIDAQQNDDFDLFVSQMLRFRQWMAANGYRNTPLYLSEFGVLMPKGIGFDPDFTEARVNAFMTKTFDYLLNTKSSLGYPADDNRLVQRFSWYSINDRTYNGRLFDPETKLPTLIGRHYAEYAAPIVEAVDVFPLQINAQPVIGAGTVATATLEAVIANSGNNLTAYPVKVRFYNGDPTQGGTLIGQEQQIELSGCGATKTVSVVWEDVPTGVSAIFVIAEPANASVVETNAANNKQFVIANPQVIYTPLIHR